jgi:O-antigen ligase
MGLSSTLTAIHRTISLNTRLVLLCFIAVSPSLGTAISAIGRFVLIALALTVIFCTKSSEYNLARNRDGEIKNNINWSIFLAISYMALSLLWTSSNDATALNTWARHARLITIPIVYLLIYNYGEARTVLRFFVIGQIFVVFSAWLLVLGMPVPWATAKAATTRYAVFGSYLEQSISQAVLLAILWHQRDWILGQKNKWWAVAIAALTLIHTLGFLIGRSGHVVALGLIALAIVYELPKRLKWLAVVVPFGLLGLALVSSKNFHERVQIVRNEIQIYDKDADVATSSGQRLFYWQTSLQAIAQQPILGYGTGSWNMQYRRLENGKSEPSSLSASDPHQLFLLWAVEGGIVGLILLCAVWAAIYRRSRQLEKQDARTLQSILAALIISGMFNSIIFGIGMGDFFCVGLGICLAFVRPRDQMDAPNHG